MTQTGTSAGEIRPFVKMHGLGNDFVVFDARTDELRLDAAQIRHLADRKAGIGCDQLIVLEPSDVAETFMRIYNADGGEVDACGNATRCIGKLLMDATGRNEAAVDTNAGLLQCSREAGSDIISVDMGAPRLDWQAIPTAIEMDTVSSAYSHGPLSTPGLVNVGNPHAVFFVDDAEAIDLTTLGPEIEHDPAFPERINVEAAQVLAPDHIRMRVWERGVGITRACGTGACATLVAAARRGLTGRDATVTLDGGDLHIAWRDDDHVILTGDAVTAFHGEVTL